MSFTTGRQVRVVQHVQSAGGDDNQINVFNYDLNDTEPGNPNSPQSLADFFRDNVTDKVRAFYSSAWNLLPWQVIEAKDPLNPNKPRSEWISGTPTAGTRVLAGEVLPRACCGVATLHTDRVGRRATGRLFLGGTLGEADQNNGQWLTSIITLWQAWLDSIPHQPDVSPPASTSHANWVVYSRTNRAEDESEYNSHVLTPVLHSKVHWLRSREI